MSEFRPTLFRRIWAWPWLLLSFTALIWAGNVVLGRAVSHQILPVTLSFIRWAGAAALVLAVAWRQVAADWPALRRSWKMLAVLSFTGIACYNTMSYHGLHDTTALNGLLLQSVMPLMVLVLAFAMFGEAPRPMQVLGVLVSFAGVTEIATHGSLADLVAFRLNPGDAWIILALAVYSLYTVLLRFRPQVHPMSFLAATFVPGALWISPLFIWEVAANGLPEAAPATFAALAYVIVLPSFVGYLCFNRGVQLIGAARAGQAIHLIPLFGSLLAVGLLGEQPHWFHAIGFGLIASGLLIAR